MHSDKKEPRSTHSATETRSRQYWPEDRNFRILSLDGGGIKGLFTASFLAEMERRTGKPISNQFDLITGTSTGGIIAIGLAAGIPAQKLADLYQQKGDAIFPKWPWPFSFLRFFLGIALARYNPENLKRELINVLGKETKLKDVASRCRLCIQAFDALNGEVAVFKTPHHPSYHLDGELALFQVALATSAAPTYFPVTEHVNGYLMGDGGVWANNPVMVGVVEAISAYNISNDSLRVLSIGCGEPKYKFGWWTRHLGGFVPWARVIFTAMRLQSQNANGQTKHLVGFDNFMRIDVECKKAAEIKLDDCELAAKLLPNEGKAVFKKHEKSIKDLLKPRAPASTTLPNTKTP